MFTMLICSISPLVLLWIINVQIPVLEAEEVKVTGYIGHDVTLPCQFIPGPDDTIIWVHWDFEPPDGEKINIIVSSSIYGVTVNESFRKGRVEIEEQSLIIRDVEFRDAGSYTWTISSFPRGVFDRTINLLVREEMLILPRMIAAGVFALIVVTMLATTCFIIRIRYKRPRDV